MKIRSALRLLLAVSAVVLVLLVAGTGLAVLQLRRAMNLENFLNDFQKDQEERVLLRDDFLLRAKTNAYLQWLVESDEVAGEIKTMNGMSFIYNKAENQALVGRIERTFKATRSILPRIVELKALTEQDEPIRQKLTHLEKRLSNQLILNSYMLSNTIGLLRQNARAGTVQARNTLLIVFGMSTLVLALTVTVTTVYVNRKLLRGIAALQTGTAIIAEGRFEYQIPVEGKNELADLAMQFNGMAGRIRHSYHSLESAIRELEGFSYSVSHDLRAPLRHVIAYTGLLKGENLNNLDEKSLHYMDVISKGATRMGRLVDDLLAYSRMGRVEMVKSLVPLDRVVASLLMELETAAAGRSVNWEIAALPTVSGDESMLTLVMQNLLANALKFTSGVPKAMIEVGSLIKGKETIVFVRDNGVGFDMNYANKLFTLFHRLHRMDEFEGTGVGLANVQRIITRHGGRVWAEGVVDRGATFYFSLPAY